MSRESAIEAGVRARRAGSYYDDQALVAAIIDAAAPHLASEPVEYRVISSSGRRLSEWNTLLDAREDVAHLKRRFPGTMYTILAVTLVPVEDQP